MNKSFTLILFMVCTALSFNTLAQEAKLFKVGKPSDRKDIQKAGTRSEAPLENPVFTKSNLLAYGYSDEVIQKNFSLVAEGYYKPLVADEKLMEISKAIRSANDAKSPADVVLESLPKIKPTSSLDETVSAYHADLEALFLANPALFESLGSAFSKAYNDPERFRHTVMIALDKGQSDN